MSYGQVIKKSPTYHKPGDFDSFLKFFYYISSLIFEGELILEFE